METVGTASLGQASSKARDLNKAGISKIFHHRVVLRIQEMLTTWSSWLAEPGHGEDVRHVAVAGFW